MSHLGKGNMNRTDCDGRIKPMYRFNLQGYHWALLCLTFGYSSTSQCKYPVSMALTNLLASASAKIVWTEDILETRGRGIESQLGSHRRALT